MKTSGAEGSIGEGLLEQQRGGGAEKRPRGFSGWQYLGCGESDEGVSTPRGEKRAQETEDGVRRKCHIEKV